MGVVRERSRSDAGMLFSLYARRVGRPDLLFEAEVSIGGSLAEMAVTVGLRMFLFFLGLNGCSSSSVRRDCSAGGRCSPVRR